MSGQSFTKILVTDVATALARFRMHKTQSNMRDLVRTSFAAVEGEVWIFREHVVEAANATYGLEPKEKAILEEEFFHVSAQGRITTQSRFLPVLSSIRFIARIAQRLASRELVNFSGTGWQTLQQAALIRNRVTHPKTAADLILSEDDVETVLEGLYWFLGQASDAMEALIGVRKDYLGQLEEVLAELRAGDAATLKLYDEISRKLQDD
jgi:hypothetical protein